MKPPMPYYGGKQRIADRIVATFPDHLHYVEPFAGGLSVLLAKEQSKLETVNDLDRHLVTFWRVLRDRPEDLMRFISMDRQEGVCCSVFRNESPALSSELIREADALADERWPQEARHYTYVAPQRVRSTNPGYCFQQAGWRRCGLTKGGHGRDQLVVLERF